MNATTESLPLNLPEKKAGSRSLRDFIYDTFFKSVQLDHNAIYFGRTDLICKRARTLR